VINCFRLYSNISDTDTSKTVGFRYLGNKLVIGIIYFLNELLIKKESKMKKDLTDLTVVLDRSGSMQMCKEDAEGGVNQFIEDQKKQEGECLLTLVQFDTDYEFVHNGVPIKDVPKYKLVPRGMTALLDAVGKAINETGERLAKMNEDDRPGLVVFVIVTDGGENSSMEFKRAQIKEMIEKQTDEYKWEFTFIGANQDAFAEAGSIGISIGKTANFNVSKSKQAYAGLSRNVSSMRGQSAGGQSVKCCYSDKERKDME